MARTEKLNETATAKLAAFVANNFKGVRNRPTSNNMSECALVAAKLAGKHGVDYFVIPAHGGMVLSPAADARASYVDFGYGLRIAAAGEIYSQTLA